MILLLGATGYIGQAFASELQRRGCCFIPLTRKAFDYTSFNLLFDYVRKMKPEFVINAAGYSGRPNIDACEEDRMETLQANVLLPQTVVRACQMTNTPWGQISSGSIYSGAKVFEAGELRIEKDLNRLEVRRHFEEHSDQFLGFTELDEPNFSFRSGPCSFYSGTKALAEESIRGGMGFIWRLRIPFNGRDEPRNLLSKLQRYSKIHDCVNSLSQLEDSVRACLDLIAARAPYGIYNINNPGAVTTRQVVEMIQRILKPDRGFDYWLDDDEFYRSGAKARRSSCILSASKLLQTGVKIRCVKEALEDSLERWQPGLAANRWTGPRSESLMSFRSD